MVDIKVKNVSCNELPEYKTIGSSGCDICSNEYSVIPSQSTVSISTGLYFEIPEGYEIQVRSRSGLASSGIQIANSPGTIDSDYRGEIKILLYNSNVDRDFTINKGDRIAQLVLQPTYKMNFIYSDKLSITERNISGFGSTGINDNKKRIITRFAPSPTGELHIGGLRTALYNYLYAKNNNGKCILRIEDTDRKRSTEIYKNLLQETLTTEFYLAFDEYYTQSERLDIYTQYINELIEKDKAYYCFCDRDENREDYKYSGRCRNLSKEEIEFNLSIGKPYTIRMRIPENMTIAFDDTIRGRISINSNELDDQILIKSDGFPTYHFAVVIDDYLMGVTNVIRGEEWISSTPKHILLYSYFDWDIPEYTHLPVMTNCDGKKLSKRDGDFSISHLLYEQGITPTAIISYLCSINLDINTICDLDEAIKTFDISKLSKSSCQYDEKKLLWFNRQDIQRDIGQRYIIKRAYECDMIDQKFVSETNIEKVLEIVKLFIHTSDNINIIAYNMHNFIYDTFENEYISPKFENYSQLVELISCLTEFVNDLESIKDDDYTATNINVIFESIVKRYKLTNKIWYSAMRMALIREVNGCDIGSYVSVLNKDDVIYRIESYIQFLGSINVD